MTITREGRRYYIEGDTYSIRDQLRSAGCHWDAGRKAWWTGDRATAERFASVSPEKKKNENPGEIELVGKAKYKGHTYYIRWMGTTSRGTQAARLVSLDGSLDFWADLTQISIVKRYGDDVTLGSLRRYIERQNQKRSAPPAAAAAQIDPVAAAARWGREAVAGAQVKTSETLMSDRHDTPTADGTVCWILDTLYVQVSHDQPCYMGEDELDDLCRHGERPGWRYQWRGVAVVPTEEELRARAQDEAERRAAKELAAERAALIPQWWSDCHQGERAEALPDCAACVLRARGGESHGIDFGSLYVVGDDVWYYHGGSYDDYRETIRVHRGMAAALLPEIERLVPPTGVAVPRKGLTAVSLRRV